MPFDILNSKFEVSLAKNDNLEESSNYDPLKEYYELMLK